jgi:pimeloyl-ACP methyl ester carboxylesterase
VIKATVPEGTPTVLVGHSMGGMTIMRLADQHPSLFGSQIVAAGLLCTSSGGLGEVALGLPAALARATRHVMPYGLRAAALAAPLLERVRHLGRDGTRLIESMIAFGPDAGPAAIAFAEEMMTDTRMAALVGFLSAMTGVPEISDCAGLREIDTLVIGAENDMLTPLEHSLDIGTKLPAARLEIVPTAGHMVMLERPHLVSEHLADLVERACGRADSSLIA